MTSPPSSAEALLLEEALDLRAGSTTLHSREPLGDGSVVGFEVADGLLYYVDTSRLRVRAETGMLLGTPDAPEARVWLHPADPHLPALAPTVFDGAVAGLLQRLGITSTGLPEIIVYRAGRRAVLRVQSQEGTIWVKVVRPSRLERTVRAHTAFADAGVPGPAVLGWSPEGLIVLEEAAGTPAADVLWEPEALVDQVDALRERIGKVRTDAPARGVAGRLDWYAARAEALANTDHLVQRIRAGVEGVETEQVVVHGDLHFGQLFLDEKETVSAVIDVDTAGIGPAAEDPAAFIAHASASALLANGATADRVWQLADAAWRRWGGGALVAELTAVHLLGHALAASDSGAEPRAESLLRVAAAVLNGREPSLAESKERLTDSFETS